MPQTGAALPRGDRAGRAHAWLARALAGIRVGTRTSRSVAAAGPVHSARHTRWLRTRVASPRLAAGHAGKVANALSKAIREGRVHGVSLPAQQSASNPQTNSVTEQPLTTAAINGDVNQGR